MPSYVQSWRLFHQFPWTTPVPRTLPRSTGRPCLELSHTKPLRWAIMARSWLARARAPIVRSEDWPVAKATWFMWHPCQRAALTWWTPPRPLFRQVRLLGINYGGNCYYLRVSLNQNVWPPFNHLLSHCNPCIWTFLPPVTHHYLFSMSGCLSKESQCPEIQYKSKNWWFGILINNSPNYCFMSRQ